MKRAVDDDINIVATKVTRAFKAQLLERAKAEDLTISQVVRQALRRYLAVTDRTTGGRGQVRRA